MKKEHLLLIVVFVLFVWASKDKLPFEYQFWKKEVAVLQVQNNSSQDLQDVAFVVFSSRQPVGTIKTNRNKTITVRRSSDQTEVVLRFMHGSELIERHVGTLDETSQYQMTIVVSLGGVVTVQEQAEKIEDNDAPNPTQ